MGKAKASDTPAESVDAEDIEFLVSATCTVSVPAGSHPVAAGEKFIDDLLDMLGEDGLHVEVVSPEGNTTLVVRLPGMKSDFVLFPRESKVA